MNLRRIQMKKLLYVVMAVIVSMTAVIGVYAHFDEVNYVNVSTCPECGQQTFVPKCNHDVYEAVHGRCETHDSCFSTTIYSTAYRVCVNPDCGYTNAIYGTHVCRVYHTIGVTFFYCPYMLNNVDE